MDTQLAADLLLSIQRRNLIIFCGAGLSIPRPSDAPRALELANQCYDTYSVKTGDHPPIAYRDNLEALTQYVFEQGPARQIDFVRTIVQWEQFRGTPNRGHLAIADFLACRAIHSAVTTNFDDLPEIAARSLLKDVDFRAALNDEQALEFREHSPLLKLHGCVTDRDHTLWCAWQLRHHESLLNSEIRRRVRSCANWLRALLANKDILLIGFWSDWSHINRSLRLLLNRTTPRPARVIVVDPSTDAELRSKAPALYEWGRYAGMRHESQSGTVFLEELRTLASRTFIEQILQSAIADFQLETGDTARPDVTLPIIESDDMYQIRRDLWGIPGNRPVREFQLGTNRAPIASGVAHLLAREKGAVLDGPSYILPLNAQSRRVRIVTGHGRRLSAIVGEFAKEPPRPVRDDFVVCAGATQDPSKPHILRRTDKMDILRGGSDARWLTLEEAREHNIL